MERFRLWVFFLSFSKNPKLPCCYFFHQMALNALYSQYINNLLVSTIYPGLRRGMFGVGHNHRNKNNNEHSHAKNYRRGHNFNVPSKWLFQSVLKSEKREDSLYDSFQKVHNGLDSTSKHFPCHSCWLLFSFCIISWVCKTVISVIACLELYRDSC